MVLDMLVFLFFLLSISLWWIRFFMVILCRLLWFLVGLIWLMMFSFSEGFFWRIVISLFSCFCVLVLRIVEFGVNLM